MNKIPSRSLALLEPGANASGFDETAFLGKQVRISTAALDSYAFSKFDPLVQDALTVAAAMEYADKAVNRPAYGWARQLHVRIPVFELAHWSRVDVVNSLLDALSFLTGDIWALDFVPRGSNPPKSAQDPLALKLPAQAVLAYSDGLDSRAVAGIEGVQLSDGLVCVRLGGRSRAANPRTGQVIPFTGVPYSVHVTRTRESSGRSRGFKFAMLSGIAAYLVDSPRILVPESGQGAIGPVLVTAAHAYPDYRNHPLFTSRMERFLKALFGYQVSFAFPRIWSTKAETLREYVSAVPSGDWAQTRSCWRSSQWSAVSGKLRHCGVCAACMLRRMSIHAAGLTESPDTYVAVDLKVPYVRDSVDPEYQHYNKAFREYAIAGALHLEHLAELARSTNIDVALEHAALIAPSLAISEAEAGMRLASLIARHKAEWEAFVEAQGSQSFLTAWTRSRNG